MLSERTQLLVEKLGSKVADARPDLNAKLSDDAMIQFAVLLTLLVMRSQLSIFQAPEIMAAFGIATGQVSEELANTLIETL